MLRRHAEVVTDDHRHVARRRGSAGRRIVGLYDGGFERQRLAHALAGQGRRGRMDVDLGRVTPLAPSVIVINESLLTAVHAQSLKLGFTFTVAEPPAALIFRPWGSA